METPFAKFLILVIFSERSPRLFGDCILSWLPPMYSSPQKERRAKKVKHAAKTQVQKVRYLQIAAGVEGKLPARRSRRCARLESFASGSAESKMSSFVSGSDVLR